MTNETKKDDEHYEHVRRDHYAHKFAIFAVAAYGWQLHGWLTGLGILVGLFIIISITNIAVMATAPDHGWLRRVRINRWAWVVVAAIILVLSGATIAEVR